MIVYSHKNALLEATNKDKNFLRLNDKIVFYLEISRNFAKK